MQYMGKFIIVAFLLYVFNQSRILKKKKKIKMAEIQGIEKLKATREILKYNIERSRELGVAIDNGGWRLESCGQRLTSLAAALRSISCKCTFYKTSCHDVDRAIGPAASLVKIFDVIRGLETSLSTADPDILAYLTTLKWMEEALGLLTDNCKLVISWLESSSSNCSSNASSESLYVMNVNKCLIILRELQATEERFRVKGGALMAALDKLETEFASLLVSKDKTLTFPPPPIVLAPTDVALLLSGPLPIIQATIDRLAANDRLEKCMSIYVQVRSSNVRKALNLDYLEISLTEFDSVLSVEPHIDQWAKHLEFAVIYLFEIEHRLCNQVFERAASKERCMELFANIALQSGMIHSFIKFGNTITQGKKEAVKLLRLLDMFTALNKVRSDFNRLFFGKACAEIQTQTRDLIKNIVDGACEIFWQLSHQVELQRTTSPPVDGSVPRLVYFVTEYCNQLLEDEYWYTLNQVVEIHQGWNHHDKYYEKGLALNEMCNIIKVIELNIEAWVKTYEEDSALYYLFLMNNHWYLCKYSKGTKVGELMGYEWVRGHEECMEYYETLYLKEGWGKLPTLLSEEGLVLFPGGRAIDRQVVKERLKKFTEAFDDMYKRQSSWGLCDKGLRLRLCKLVLQLVLPCYSSYLEKYIEFEVASTADEHIKYTAESLEKMITSLFEPKVGKYMYDTNKCTALSVKDVANSHLSSTPAAA